jgi:uncharacterized protein with HEPN domain
MRHDVLYLKDIVEAIDAIGRFLDGIDETTFMADELRQSAVLQKLMIIGEAAAHVSTEVRTKAPHVPWSQIVGFRNIAIHAYFNVNWPIVWTAATKNAPALRGPVQILLEDATGSPP